MREEEFDAAFWLRPFGILGAKKVDPKRIASLAANLWGKTSDDLRRQLLAPSSEIPPGFDRADLSELLGLLQWIEQLLSRTSKPLNELLVHMTDPSQTLVVGTQQYTHWEARFEIIRRAIEHLENR